MTKRTGAFICAGAFFILLFCAGFFTGCASNPVKQPLQLHDCILGNADCSAYLHTLTIEDLRRQYETAESTGLFDGSHGEAHKSRLHRLLTAYFRARHTHIPDVLWNRLCPGDWTPLLEQEDPKATALSRMPLIKPGEVQNLTKIVAARAVFRFDGNTVHVPPDQVEVMAGVLHFPEINYTPPVKGQTSGMMLEEVLSKKEGKTMRLGEPMGSGAMRYVYRHPENPGLVIKVYDPEKIDKMRVAGIMNLPTPVITAYFLQREIALHDYLCDIYDEYLGRNTDPPFRIAEFKKDKIYIERGILVQTFIKGSRTWKDLPESLTFERLMNLDRYFEFHQLYNKNLYKIMTARFGISITSRITENSRPVKLGIDVGKNYSNFFLDESGVPILIDW